MAYGDKYLFRWEADNGHTYRIILQEKDYTGPVTQRAMGGAPLLRRDQGDYIWGTSLTFYPEATVNGEFAFLYTSSATQYRVRLTEDEDDYAIWEGFVSPELYAEPDIDAPYDVEVIATDGLGELKLYDWTPTTTKATFRQHIINLVSRTGLLKVVSPISTLRTAGTTAANFWSTVEVDLGHLYGETYYVVLEELLKSLNAVITLDDDTWKVIRITDIASTNINPIRYGAADTYTWWPIGHLDTEIVPAKKKVVVKAPNFYKKSILANPDMTSQTDWLLDGRAYYYPVTQTNTRAYYDLEPAIGSYTAGEISQYITFTKLPPLRLTVISTGWNFFGSNYDLEHRLAFMISYESGATTYYLQKTGDEGHISDYNWTTDVARILFENGEELQELEVLIPGRTESGELSVAIQAVNGPGASTSMAIAHHIYSVYLNQMSEYVGLQLNINLVNSARNENEPVELSLSNYSDSANPDLEKFQYGVPTIANAQAQSWQTSQLAEQSYIGFVGMDIALLNASPRIRKKGKLNNPSVWQVPLLFSDGNNTFLVESFSYDLLTSEMNVQMISLPATTLTVESQVLQTIEI